MRQHHRPLHPNQQFDPSRARPHDPLAHQLFTLTNTVRAAGVICQGIASPPTSPLQEDQTLTAAVQHRANDLAATEDFTHTSANGKDYVYWINQVHLQAEFAYTHLGENLGMAGSVSQMIEVFKASHTGHCETQFTNTYQDITTHQWLPGLTHILQFHKRLSGTCFWPQ
ncbi:CAP domain-containing protein, partial [Deinococcus ruber]|uniref:CAP domain-containing protein n=1 Tax=Deinococcus ruber TaxID=1848197 RepID=UPI001E51BA5D